MPGRTLHRRVCATAYWFNGNGIPERYWIPLETGADYTLTPCLSPLARFRNDIHVVSGLDNPNARLAGVGNDHQRSMSALVSGENEFDGKQDLRTKVMIALFGLFAEVERDLISERTKEGLAAAKAKGKLLGRPKGALGTSRLDGKEGSPHETEKIVR